MQRAWDWEADKRDQNIAYLTSPWVRFVLEAYVQRKSCSNILICAFEPLRKASR